MHTNHISNVGLSSNLRDIQRAGLSDMITSAKLKDETITDNSLIWKILIYDNIGRDILAPFLHVNELRKMGVTLHLSIQSSRDRVPKTPAVYFCAPTIENISFLVKDIADNLYDELFINFVSSISQTLLEQFAASLVKSTTLENVKHIHIIDRHLSFLALEPGLFSLLLPDLIFSLNSKEVQSNTLNEYYDQISLGLVDVILNQGQLPIIVFESNASTAVREVVDRIVSRLHDAVQNRQISSLGAMYGRPVLFLTDRTTDLSSALMHPFTYDGLLMDVSNCFGNKISFIIDGSERTIELNPDHDTFYSSFGHLNFEEVSVQCDHALEQFKKEYNLVSDSSNAVNFNKQNLMTDEEFNRDDMPSPKTSTSKMLANAPKLMEKKRLLDTHVTLAHTLLQHVRNRQLDLFNGVESFLVRGNGLDRDLVYKVFRDKCGSETDRSRFFLIVYIITLYSADSQWVTETLTPLYEESYRSTNETGIHTALTPISQISTKQDLVDHLPAIRFINDLYRGFRALSNDSLPQTSKGTGRSAAALSFGWTLTQKLAKNIANTLGKEEHKMLPLTHIIDALLAPSHTPATSPHLKAVLPTSNRTTSQFNASPNPPLPRVIANTSAPSTSSSILDNLIGIDPRSKNKIDLRSLVFNQALAFVIGGACIIEYDDLYEWQKQHPTKIVWYGGTDLQTGERLFDQLNKLGRE